MIEPFTTLESVPTPLLRDNIDTDVIIPGSYLKTVSRQGLGEGCFHSLRFRADGGPDPDSVFADPRYQGARILLAGANFGCGSSREHAAWALLDMGYRAVIAPGFADIFESNAGKNGILTVRLDAVALQALADDAAAGRAIRIDLAAQTVTDASGAAHRFEIDPFRKRCLLEGLDEIALTLSEHADAIAAFEAVQKRDLPWLHDDRTHAG